MDRLSLKLGVLNACALAMLGIATACALTPSLDPNDADAYYSRGIAYHVSRAEGY